ncbi:hypothetical protein Tco_0672331 [Tanacetum coccineum]
MLMVPPSLRLRGRTFPSILHSWYENILIQSLRTSDEANALRTIEVERLIANELFIVSRFFYRSSSRSDDELDNGVEEEDGEWIRFLGGNSSGTRNIKDQMYDGCNTSGVK